jgi:hypothetical protein
VPYRSAPRPARRCEWRKFYKDSWAASFAGLNGGVTWWSVTGGQWPVFCRPAQVVDSVDSRGSHRAGLQACWRWACGPRNLMKNRAGRRPAPPLPSGREPGRGGAGGAVHRKP